MTQFGIAACIVGAVLWPQARRWERFALLGLLFLAALRAYTVSERLAAIELFVPTAVVFVARAYAKRSLPSWRRTLIRLVPLLALPTLVIGFTVYGAEPLVAVVPGSHLSVEHLVVRRQPSRGLLQHRVQQR